MNEPADEDVPAIEQVVESSPALALLPFSRRTWHVVPTVAPLANRHQMTTRAKNGIFKPKAYVVSLSHGL